jgi:hypothetical protein
MRYLLAFVFSALLYSSASAHDDVSVGINLGFNVGSYPNLVRVPGYPVYYDPDVRSNYFFYDGLYWAYQNDNWYQSGWYNGPWNAVQPAYVPMYVLRVPVRYYRRPPQYFHGWRPEAAPHWDEHWGKDWQEQRTGWNQWDRKSAPPPAPLPVYQKSYGKDRYPVAPEQQQSIRSEKYRYEPHDPETKQHWQQQAAAQSAPHEGQNNGHGNPRTDRELDHGDGQRDARQDQQ